MSVTKRTFLLSMVLAPLAWAASARATRRPAQAIPAANLLEPAALAASLAADPAHRPLVLQVGSRVLYAQAHVPGAEYAGPGGEESGLALLRARVATLPRLTPIVIYCGCCPWSRCPNITPAYEALTALGLTHVTALHITDDFGADWAERGYPVASGE